jgi:hypothetical protein
MAVRAGHAGTRHGRRVAVIGAALVAALGPASTALAAAPATQPAAALSAVTRATAQPAGSSQSRGWAPVPYRNAELSVPGSWLVETAQQQSCGISPARGMIFAGIGPRLPKGTGCSLPARLAWILPAGHIAPGLRHRRPTAVIHGFAVYRLPGGKTSARYLVPGLRVLVGVRGPQARRVLATLNRSPLSAVLRSGPPSPVPSGWTWQRSGGVWFAAPRSWTLQRAHQWATCGTGMEPSTLLLIDATRRPLPLPCPLQIPTAAADQAQPGLTVVTGKYAAASVGQHYGRCQERHGVRICLAAVTGQGGLFSGVLIFSVARPHHRATAFFLLGLSGTGYRALAVFGSVGPTSR